MQQLCRQKAFFLFYLGKSGYTGIHSLDNEHFPIKAPHSKKYGKFAQYYVKEIHYCSKNSNSQATKNLQENSPFAYIAFINCSKYFKIPTLYGDVNARFPTTRRFTHKDLD